MDEIADGDGFPAASTLPPRVRPMTIRPLAILMVLATAGCHAPPPVPLAPNAMRALVVPAIGQTRATVARLNGEPDHREEVRGLEMWIYARTLPAVADLRSRAAIVWFRDGVVVDVGVSGGFPAPNPTLPAGS